MKDGVLSRYYWGKRKNICNTADSIEALEVKFMAQDYKSGPRNWNSLTDEVLERKNSRERRSNPAQTAVRPMRECQYWARKTY